MAGVRIVLDTQVWLDWLVFDDPSLAALREAHAAGRVEIVIDEACELELQRVLAYDLGKHSLSPDAQARCVERMRAVARRVEGADGAGLPRCRDPDDQKFLSLAAGTGAHLLLSKDRAVLSLARRVAGFRIVAPGKLGPL